MRVGLLRVGPVKPQNICVLMHGIASQAEDIQPTAKRLATHLPDTAFLIPQGFEAWPGLPSARQWFSMHGAAHLIGQRLQAAIPMLEDCLETWLRREGLQPQQTVVAGFSQGGGMALACGLYGRLPIAGVISFCGDLFPLQQRVKAVPVGLIAGQVDDTVSVARMQNLKQWLDQQQVPAHLSVIERMPHRVTGKATPVAVDYLRRMLA